MVRDASYGNSSALTEDPKRCFWLASAHPEHEDAPKQRWIAAPNVRP